MRHKERRYGYDAKRALAICGVLAASAAALFQGEFTALASPTFSRTAEEWAVLQDDRLTWDEIPDLIHEYNATVRDNEQAYADDERNLMDAQDIREAMIDQADDYDNMAMDIAGSSEASAAQYRAQANSMRDQADDNVTDKDILRWNYDRIEDSLVQNARLTFLDYYSSIEEQKKARTALDTAKLAYDSAVNRFNVGMATETEVLTARESMLQAEASIITADAAVDSTKKLLLVTCGWGYDSVVEIGALPEIDIAEIDATDPAADTETAIKQNYTLRTDERMLQNTNTSNNYVQLREKYEKKISDDTDQVRASVRSAYDALVSARNAYNDAVSARQLAADAAASAERNLAIGSISQSEYQTALKQLESAGYDEEIARIGVMTAKVNYDACVDGLASAGSTT